MNDLNYFFTNFQESFGLFFCGLGPPSSLLAWLNLLFSGLAVAGPVLVIPAETCRFVEITSACGNEECSEGGPQAPGDQDRN